MQLLDGMSEVASLRFETVKEGARGGPLRKGLFTGDGGLFSCLSPHFPVSREEGHPHSLVLDGIQGRRVSLEVGS